MGPRENETAWRMNLQLFAEDGGTPEGQPEGTPDAEEREDGGGKTYTQDEVIRIIQSETDKRVTQALKKQQKAYEQKLSLSGLDEKEHAIAEKEQEMAQRVKKLMPNADQSMLETLCEQCADEFMSICARDDVPAGASAAIEQMAAFHYTQLNAEGLPAHSYSGSSGPRAPPAQ